MHSDNLTIPPELILTSEQRAEAWIKHPPKEVYKWSNTPMKKTLDEMSGPELVQEYNALAAGNGLKPIQRFATREKGLARVKALKANGPKLVTSDPITTATDPSSLCEQFGQRAGTNRESLLNALHAELGKQIPISSLWISVYGESAVDAGKLGQVMKGLLVAIEKGALPYEIRKDKDEKKEITYGLYTK